MPLSSSIDKLPVAHQPDPSALGDHIAASHEFVPANRRPVVILGDGSEAARNAARRAELIAQDLDAPVYRVNARPSACVAAQGRPADQGWSQLHAIEDVASHRDRGIEGAGLLVTNVADGFQLSDVVLGTQVEQLVREFRIPVLVVKQPASRRYRRALVGVKLDAPASELIAHARMVAPRARMEVVHVLGNSDEFRLRIADASEAAIRSRRARLLRNASRHVNGLIAAAHGGAARAIVSRLSVGNTPDRLLQMSQSPRAELVVLGKQPRHWLADLFLDRGVARNVLAGGGSDVLLVPVNA